MRTFLGKDSSKIGFVKAFFVFRFSFEKIARNLLALVIYALLLSLEKIARSFLFG